MFSQLGPLFKTTFRQAESNDTRQHIPHDERDKYRKKREEEKHTTEREEAWTDDTSVSVTSLQTFLINFLKETPEGDESINTSLSEQSGSARPHEKSRPTNTHNAKAVRAYQNMAQQAQETSNSTPERPKADREKIQSEEVRDIYKLIDDLDILKQKNIAVLRIPPADSFIISLKNAVKQALR